MSVSEGGNGKIGKIYSDAACRADSGLCAHVGCVYDNPRSEIIRLMMVRGQAIAFRPRPAFGRSRCLWCVGNKPSRAADSRCRAHSFRNSSGSLDTLAATRRASSIGRRSPSLALLVADLCYPSLVGLGVRREVDATLRARCRGEFLTAVR